MGSFSPRGFVLQSSVKHNLKRAKHRNPRSERSPYNAPLEPPSSWCFPVLRAQVPDKKALPSTASGKAYKIWDQGGMPFVLPPSTHAHGMRGECVYSVRTFEKIKALRLSVAVAGLRKPDYVARGAGESQMMSSSIASACTPCSSPSSQYTHRETFCSDLLPSIEGCVHSPHGRLGVSEAHGWLHPR